MHTIVVGYDETAAAGSSTGCSGRAPVRTSPVTPTVTS